MCSRDWRHSNIRRRAPSKQPWLCWTRHTECVARRAGCRPLVSHIIRLLLLCMPKQVCSAVHALGSLHSPLGSDESQRAVDTLLEAAK